MEFLFGILVIKIKNHPPCPKRLFNQNAILCDHYQDNGIFPLPGDQFCTMPRLYEHIYVIFVPKTAVFTVMIHHNCPKGQIIFFSIFFHKTVFHHLLFAFPYREIKSANTHIKNGISLMWFVIFLWFFVVFDQLA